MRVVISPGTRGAVAVDVRDSWDEYVLGVLRCHPSQIGGLTLGLFAEAGDEQRRVWLTHRPPWRRWDSLRDHVLRSAQRLRHLVHNFVPRAARRRQP